MRKIVFTKIVLIIFLGSFQNILSQSKKIDEINQSISYWENDYSYKEHDGMVTSWNGGRIWDLGSRITIEMGQREHDRKG